MSGVEIAGFVLAGFPLLISAAEHYQEGFEPLVKWKRFRTDFISFIDAVDIEKQLFDQMLERFLMSAEVPEEELKLFMTDPDYDGWQRKELVEVLQLRLGPSYPVYMSTINRMNGLMSDLQALLSLKDGKVEWANDGASRWDYQLKRIHLSFSKKGPKTVKSLETHNRKLRELLDSQEKLDNMKAIRKDVTWANIFESIKRHASSLHSALKKGWACNCKDPHVARLRLQKRTAGGWSSDFNVGFHVRNEAARTVVIWREVMISIRTKDGGETELLETHANLDVRQDLTQLRRNFKPKPAPQLNLGVRPASASGVNTPLNNNGLPDKISQTISSSTIISTSNSPRTWLSGRKGRAKKSVRFNSDVLAEKTPRSPLIPKTSASNTQHSLNSEIPRIEIKDLCAILHTESFNSPSLGYLNDDGEHTYDLRPAIDDTTELHDADSLVNLEELLNGKSDSKPSRLQRYRIASILASSLLQLQSTPWLASKLEKQNIFFRQHESNILFERPYIHHAFAPSKFHTTPEACAPLTRFAARNSLSSLGILLLELCFGETIESQGLRKFHLDPDGKPHAGTDYLTARDWSEMVCEEEPALEQIIKCCVFCAFEEKPDWGNKAFVQAVYGNVVGPLEKLTAAKWQST